MPVRPMLDDIELQHVQKIEVDGDQVLVQHSVPALEGDFLQRLGRRGTQITITGVLTGPEAGDGLKNLRDKFRAAEPVSFVADIATATQVDQVLIEEMGVRELAGKPERFEYAFTFREYIPPPPPEEEPEIETPEPPVEEIHENVGTLIVEVVVEGELDFDFSRISVTVQGNQQDGTALSRTLTNRTDNIWTEERIPASQGEYTVQAVETNPETRSGSTSAQVRAGERNRVRITLRSGVIIARAFVVHFWFDKSFIEPCMQAVLRQVAEYAQAHSDEKLVIVGHTDKMGDDPPVLPLYNQSLSERRARSVFSYLTFGLSRTGALAEWDQLRRQRTPGERRSLYDTWSTREYQYMLQDLGYYQGNVDSKHGPLTDAAVQTFQRDKGLTVDGIVGDQTWPVLIEAYLSQDALAVPESQFLLNCEGEILKWLGCGEQDPIKNTEDAWRPNRRTELLFVRTDSLPCEVPQPDTFDLPIPGTVGSGWCLGPGDPDARCCFTTRQTGVQNKWLVQPAEPGTIIVQGSITFEDGTPLADVEYVLIAQDGEYMDGERQRGSDRGRPIPGRTAVDGTFAYLNKQKGIGIYTMEIIGPYIAWLEGEPADVAKGNVVCKRLDGTSDFNVVVVQRPGDPSASGPFPVGEDDYVEGTFSIPPITGESNRQISVTLRALVRYPAQSGGRRRPVSTCKASYPLVVIVHGNHRVARRDGTPIHSYQGFEYLARHLASYGYITISIDHNDLNRAGLGATHRALAILKHIDVMENKNSSDPRLAGKIDLNNIALVGHSRGGEAVVAAQHINITQQRGRNIKAVVSIAPTDDRDLVHTTTPYLVICGSADSDVHPNNPASIYDRAAPLKSMLLIYGAIHNFFNTHPDWIRPRGTQFGERDIARQDSRVIAPKHHLNTAKGYITPFLELVLRSRTIYKPYFNRYMRPASLANIEIHHQFQDPQRFNVDDFEQEPLYNPGAGMHDRPQNSLGLPVEFTNLVSYKEWNHTTHYTRAGFIKWDRNQRPGGEYKTKLFSTIRPASTQHDVSGFRVLSFRVTLEFDGWESPSLHSSLNPPNKPQDFFVSLVDRHERKASVRAGVVASIPYTYIHHEELRRGVFGQMSNHNKIFKVIRIPLSLFQTRNPNLSLRELQAVLFEFRQIPSGDIIIDSIEFSQ